MDIQSFTLGFAAGLAVLGWIWLILDIRRVLNEPRKAIEDFKRSFDLLA